ncbi:hypothetical protein ACJRO7_028821 [Eucalyptus globulus]|uniref:Plant thionin family protein n=1 Tax=Eucalyptus globulus TaxID=34317 RepID=A0ABD3K2T2_EUCGL
MATRSTIFAITVIAVLLMARTTFATPECVRECMPSCAKSGRSEQACAAACIEACDKAQPNGFEDWGWGWGWGGVDKKIPLSPNHL